MALPTRLNLSRKTVASSGPLKIKSVAFPECSGEYQDFTPCTDPKRWKKFGVHRLTFLERHCPPLFERKECLIPPPDGYKLPMSWPKSRDECWYRNVPYDWINKQKSNQNWLRKEGKSSGSRVGVASWGGSSSICSGTWHSGNSRHHFNSATSFPLELVRYGSLLEMSHPMDGIRWYLPSRNTPYTSSWRFLGSVRSTCELRKPMERLEHDRGRAEVRLRKLQDLLTSMCFTLYNKKDDIAVWQKSKDNSCYSKLAIPDAYPPKCDDGTEPDAAWYTPLRPCVVVPNEKFKALELNSIPNWPERLHVAPERIGDIHGGSAGAFKHDDAKWNQRVKHYKKLLPAFGTDKIRNVMDMNTVYGGFAAAVIDDPLWVMNVVSSYADNTLAVVYDRGLIGTYHDWCEAFSTYPRTYDLLHLDGLFTAESHRCGMKYVLLEMDRILRPNGYAIIRESSYFVDAVATIAKGMRWECRKEETEYGVEKENILICQKKLWYSSYQTSR
ncbi:S-adenosyl-L-methionine-dependent methyltransferases superfamily protein [Actinidia rufa]|uniref:Methyltransferase n=1 Tax=Actinidia rufa TaxID=165716 RepID=A0A7J0H0T2_9ERIC|nr:S-adenosyl-L-methionine-dependent methyltransferases superfamily protein [Actinidia rufa]